MRELRGRMTVRRGIGTEDPGACRENKDQLHYGKWEAEAQRAENHEGGFYFQM